MNEPFPRFLNLTPIQRKFRPFLFLSLFSGVEGFVLRIKEESINRRENKIRSNPVHEYQNKYNDFIQDAIISQNCLKNESFEM